jgi:sugar diacid utilization regulator
MQSMQSILRSAAELASRLVQCQATSFMLWHPETSRLQIESSFGLTSEYVEYVNHRRPVCVDESELARGPSGTAWKKRLPVVIRSVPDDDSLKPWLTMLIPQAFQSMVSVPLEFDDQLLGVLNCYSTVRRDFTAEHINLLTLIARQVSTAIGVHRLVIRQRQEIRRLLRERDAIAKQIETMNHKAHFHHHLNALAIDGHGLKDMLLAIEKELGYPCNLYDQHYRSLLGDGSAPPPHAVTALKRLPPPHADSGILTVDPDVYVGLRLALEWVGFLRVQGIAPTLTPSQAALLQCSAQALAMEVNRIAARQEVEARSRSAAFLNLLHPPSPDPVYPVQQAFKLGLRADQPYQIGVVELSTSPPQAENARQSLYTFVTQSLHLLCAVEQARVVICHPYAPDAQPPQWVEEVEAALHRIHISYRLGLGRPHPIARLAESYQEALKTVAALAAAGCSNCSVSYDQLGLTRILFEAVRPDVLREYAHTVLGPLLALEPKNRDELMQTLSAYLESGCHLKQTAARLFVHPNTVKYRLEKIQQQCDVRLDRPEQLLSVSLAVNILRVHPGV